ncbi:MAG: P-loop NTPase [Mariprofundaceae bacterium]
MTNLISQHLSPTGETASAKKMPKIWAVGSGKGGVGKSFVSANLGLAIARQGKRVVMVDLDLGGANLHTCLGIGQPDKTLSDFFTADNRDINALITPVCDNIGVISGAADGLQIANIKHFQKIKILRNLRKIAADYIILDLGAGTTFNTLDFFVHADRGILSVIPEPTSIENTYRFLKCVCIRKLKTVDTGTQHIIQNVLTQKRKEGRKIKTLAALLSTMAQLHPEHSTQLAQTMSKMNMHLIVNQVIESSDIEMGHSFKVACKNYFGMDVDYLGYLHHDTSVLKALRLRKPFISQFPQSRLAINLDHMAATLMTRDAC